MLVGRRAEACSGQAESPGTNRDLDFGVPTDRYKLPALRGRDFDAQSSKAMYSRLEIGVEVDLAQAINKRIIIEFRYDGLPRMVQPATHGRSTTGKESLRGCLIGGMSHRNTIPCWEMFSVGKIQNLVFTEERFSEFAVDGYTRGDSAMPIIFAEH